MSAPETKKAKKKSKSNTIVRTLDGNEAVAIIAHKTNEVCAIYPITPSSTMGELADQWSAEKRTNLWGTIPLIAEMQSEGGASGAVHGALQAGALTSTFTASQGLLLMIPNMYKIAGELTPTVFHVAARALATQGLSIFGDHSDVMAVRATGFAMLSSSSVQEAHDMALIAQASTLESRVPFIHFFDGFRTSHEVSKIHMLPDETIRTMISDDLVIAHRGRALNPDHPFIRGTAQNPDVYFQSRETVNPYHEATPTIVQKNMDLLAKLTGRSYHLFDYYGHPKATRVIVIMGSGSEAVRETVEHLESQGEKVGMVQVHLFRPLSKSALVRAIPKTAQAIAVLDRTKEVGAGGEPLYEDVITALVEAQAEGSLPQPQLPRVVGGRYGLGSKEFTPAMIIRIFEELAAERPQNHFTIGIKDDVGHTSLDYDENLSIEPDDVSRALFFGLGADGTVGANKNSIKIIGEGTDFFAQGYFEYDSKKSGSKTTSHLRFGPRPIRSSYLISSATFVACHQFNFLEKIDVLERSVEGSTFLLNSPYDEKTVWDKLPREAQQHIINKKLRFYVIDAYAVARETGMGSRINTVMQTCFFYLSGVLPPDEAIAKIKTAIEKTYGKKGEEVVRKNFAAVDQTIENLRQVDVPTELTSTHEIPAPVPAHAPEFVRNVTGMMMADRGNELTVGALPIDGTYPSGTTTWEKRNVSMFVPVWEEDLCIQCGNCSFVCPHSCIRSKFYEVDKLAKAPPAFKSSALSGRGYPDQRYTLQVYVEDCTGCALCVEVCPAKSRTDPHVKAINMKEKEPILAAERENASFFETLPFNDRGRVDFSSVRGVQYLRPLFEFCGACAGCGETPYLKVLSQLFGDRMMIANATGCSSIYGGNLPTTPWVKNAEGRGPAWSNSLFEDNAEFGFGFRLAADKHTMLAERLLEELSGELKDLSPEELLGAPQKTEAELRAQYRRVTSLKNQLSKSKHPRAKELLSIADHLVRRSIWIIGGDGWAYDIGSGGVDHVLASGRNVNILVMDTEVYSNTGGQASKSTPLAAVAKFAASGKATGKKDLALMAIAYGHVYVSRIAMGANPQQTLLALREAEAYDGPSLTIAYSHCIAHGINMQHGLNQQKLAVQCGHWPLFRYNPELKRQDRNPWILDSQKPKVAFKDYAYNEIRYNMLRRTDPEHAEELMRLATADTKLRWELYEEMASRGDGPVIPTLD